MRILEYFAAAFGRSVTRERVDRVAIAVHVDFAAYEYGYERDARRKERLAD
ncbi:hypothetical protein SDC9_138081 [bioreactor metagenome]|uniref:Uncharacterized protein n=1 Tax=bioreactor metagenome TaxID=1076179 RepID=A0A645DPB7_9ZZZZ